MTTRPIALTAAAVALAAAAVACGGSAPDDSAAAEVLAPLRPAPTFELSTLDGADSLTSALVDSTPVVLMNFWASWCIPCRAEVPDLIDLQDAYGGPRFTVLGITVNDLPRDSRAFAEEMAMDYPLAIGTPRMLERYGLSPWLPTTLLVVEGQIVEEWVGPRVRADLEYPIRVALGLAPNLDDVIQRRARDEAAGGR